MSKTSLTDVAPTKRQFLADVLDGLCRRPKSLPCKYLYDAHGSRLFEQICDLDEYYLTRTEVAIMRRYAPEMAQRCGPGCAVVEYGSGSSLKTRLLLDHLERPAAYLPVDISKRHLRQSADDLAADYPGLRVLPVCADFTGSFRLPDIAATASRRVVYFPGSTIGNFGPEGAVRLLRSIAQLIGPDGGLLIGVDLRKSRDILEPAYNDAGGVTRQFNLNLLSRINRELDADFAMDQFEHRAFFNSEQSRIEMHLVSQAEQTVKLDGETIHFSAGETIHTENSYKYTPGRFRGLAEDAALSVQDVWQDDRGYFSVQFLTRPG